MANAPTIAIDYTPALTQGGGIGRYTREMVAALAQQDTVTQFRLFAAGYRQQTLPSSPGPNFTWRPAQLDIQWLARLWHRARLPLPIERWTGPLDLLHATDFTLPPTQPGTYTLLTIHDLSYVRAPETADASLQAYLNLVVPRSVRRANHILADSEATRQDLIELYDTSPEKISVLYSGVDARFKPISDSNQLIEVRDKYNIGTEPFIFSLGTVQPRKNYLRLVEAFRKLDRLDLKLVIAGGKGWLDTPLYERIAALDLEDRVQFIGFARDEDLPALYSAAHIFAFPSLYEGFGLPPLEAMACGTPVIVSNTSSLPEVVGEAGLLIDPYNIAAITAALERLLIDEALRQQLSRAGRRQAQQFTWEKSAVKLGALYHTLLGP